MLYSIKMTGDCLIKIDEEQKIFYFFKNHNRAVVRQLNNPINFIKNNTQAKSAKMFWINLNMYNETKNKWLKFHLILLKVEFLELSQGNL